MLWITSAKLNNIYIEHAKLQLALTYFHDYDYALNDCVPNDYVLNDHVLHGYDHDFNGCVLRDCVLSDYDLHVYVLHVCDLCNCVPNDCVLFDFFSFLFYFIFLS